LAAVGFSAARLWAASRELLNSGGSCNVCRSFELVIASEGGYILFFGWLMSKSKFKMLFKAANVLLFK
jgi:hypothetical protein